MSELGAEIAWIRVTQQADADVRVVNHSTLKLIGAGRQGAVFWVNPVACVKVFGSEEDCSRELDALSLGQPSDIFPRVYDKGANYIVMEYIGGVNLREYLQSHPLTEPLSMKLIDMLVTFKKIGLERIDCHSRHIFVQPDGGLKVIDVGRTVRRNQVYPYPKKLLNSLGVAHQAIFLDHVKSLAPRLYLKWQYYIGLEALLYRLFKEA